MCGAADVMLSEKGGHSTAIGVNELSLSDSPTPFHFPQNTHVYVQFLSEVLIKKHGFVYGQKTDLTECSFI
jgi:hypothetical protein